MKTEQTKSEEIKVKEKISKKTKVKDAKKIELSDETWYKLDNAGLIYPSAANDNWNFVYGVSAILKEEVKPDVLQQALEVVIKRFPHFNVYLKHGFFWYHLQQCPFYPTVQPEVDYPCRKMELGYKKHLFRVQYYNKKIIFETFHSLTDGTGASRFLVCLLCKYFELLGHKITDKDLQMSYKDKPIAEDMEDSFLKYYDKSGTNTRSAPNAYQIKDTREEKPVLNIITGVMSVKELKVLAKQKNATITELFSAILLKSILNQQKNIEKQTKPVALSIPINARKYFPSNTTRNFASYICLKADKSQEDLSIEELILVVKEQMAKINKEFVQKNINANVKAQKNLLVRLMPLFIKNLALKFSYTAFGEKKYSSVITNIGVLNTPPEFTDLVERFDCTLGEPKLNKLVCAVISFEDKISVTFSDVLKEHLIEREFFRYLSQNGINIYIESNIK